MRFVLVALFAALVLVVVGCGGDDEGIDDMIVIEMIEIETGIEIEMMESAQVGGALKGIVGFGFDISLMMEDGEVVSTFASGLYELEIEDLLSAHNFYLSGFGVDILIDVVEEGMQNFLLSVAIGLYSFVCDLYSFLMSGSFEVVG